MKKLRPEVIDDLYGGGIFGLLDQLYCTSFNITEDELDFFCKHMSDEELNMFNDGLGDLKAKSSFTDKRNALEIRNKYLEKYKIRK